MNKIIVIGCPGSGKSTLVRNLKDILNYPVLHLDKIYHIDNNTHITRDELRQKVAEFASSSDKWIIDGNYISTVEERVILADTVVIIDIDTETCIQNVYNRSKLGNREDMADGFDSKIINPEFIDFIKKFKNESLPKIMDLVEKYKKEKKFVILKNYNEVDKFVNNIKKI